VPLGVGELTQVVERDAVPVVGLHARVGVAVLVAIARAPRRRARGRGPRAHLVKRRGRAAARGGDRGKLPREGVRAVEGLLDLAA
jgi:hypothetical protein